MPRRKTVNVPEYGTHEYREYRQARRYGMSVVALREMLQAQNYQCKICKTNIAGTKFNVDHDPDCCINSARKTTCGKCTRGLVCHSCNLMLGHVENAIYWNRLTDILEYLGYDDVRIERS